MNSSIEQGDIVYTQSVTLLGEKNKKGIRKQKFFTLPEEGSHFICVVIGKAHDYHKVGVEHASLMMAAEAQLVRLEDIVECFGAEGEDKLYHHMKAKYIPKPAPIKKTRKKKR